MCEYILSQDLNLDLKSKIESKGFANTRIRCNKFHRMGHKNNFNDIFLDFFIPCISPLFLFHSIFILSSCTQIYIKMIVRVIMSAVLPTYISNVERGGSSSDLIIYR